MLHKVLPFPRCQCNVIIIIFTYNFIISQTDNAVHVVLLNYIIGGEQFKSKTIHLHNKTLCSRN